MRHAWKIVETIKKRSVVHMCGMAGIMIAILLIAEVAHAWHIFNYSNRVEYDVLAKTSNSKPAWGDINGDDKPDIVLCESTKVFRYYQYNSSLGGSFPWHEASSNPFSGVTPSNSGPSPALADMDDDGDLDLLYGNANVAVHLVINGGSSSSPTFSDPGTQILYALPGEATPGTHNDVADDWAAPAAADVDGDDDIDLIVGGFNGLLAYYENIGTKSSPLWMKRTGSNDPVADINAARGTSFSSAQATLADMNGDGRPDLIVGSSNGKVHCYLNSSPLSFGKDSIPGSSFELVTAGVNAAPAAIDLDGDGDTDLLLGDSSGKLYLIMNENRAPTANAGTDKQAHSGDSVALSGSGTDLDSDALHYSWRQISGPLVTIVNSDSANASFTAETVLVPTDLIFRLTVTDTAGARNTDDVVVSVSPAGSGGNGGDGGGGGGGCTMNGWAGLGLEWLLLLTVLLVVRLRCL